MNNNMMYNNMSNNMYNNMSNIDQEYMQTLGLPGENYPITTMPQQQLESMYPKTYNIIQPVVESTCDKMAGSYGPTFTPTREQLESMVDDVYSKVEEDVDMAVRQSLRGRERQFFGGGRRILRDFISALLIASLLRRRRPFYGYPGYSGYPGYYGGYNPYGGFPY